MAEEPEEEDLEENESPLLGLDGISHVLEICGFMTQAQHYSILYIYGSFADVADFGKMRTKNPYDIADRSESELCRLRDKRNRYPTPRSVRI